MKVCFFNTAQVWGGGEKWHLDMSTALNAEGCDVVVVSNKASELLHRADACGLETKGFSISNFSFLNPILLFKVYRFFKRQQFDVVVMNFSKDLKVAAPMSKLAGVAKRIYRRGSAIPIKNTAINRFLFSKCLTHVIANSESTKATILQNNKNLFPAEKIKVLYNGIDFNGFGPQQASEHNPIVIGTLGRLEIQKRHDILIEIASLLKEQGLQFKMLIGGEGRLRADIEQQVNTLNLNNHIVLKGFVNDVAKFFEQIDIFVLTSEWEGFGYVLAEAMRSSKPIVAFDTSSNPELVFDGQNGFLVPWQDNARFANAICQLVGNSELRTKMGRTGFNIANQRFNIAKNKQLTINYLKE
ncbi:MAG: glycosyltransferase [Salinivirgaceae bacterium]|nr:glycosyltransferase [Salinivirgaceae bacterium]